MKICIADELEQECVVFLNVLKELNLAVHGEIILDTLKSSNDFAILIALDYWKNNNKKVMRNKSQATEINKQIEILAQNLIGETYSGAHWLLLYEIDFHKLIKQDLWMQPKNEDFFDKLQELKICFYTTFKKR